MQGALEGIRVLEFTAGMAGPWIGRFLAYCGAEVIKVESRDRPDVTRMYVPPAAPELGVQTQLSPWLTDWNAGKKFVALDLTRPEAVELCRRLVAKCDVVVENYACGVVGKLGLGYEQLRAVKRDLIMFGSCGFGDSGPWSRYVTWGPNLEAMSGLAAVSGFAGRDCTITQYAYPDAVGALHGLFAILCALDHRRRTGEGQYIDLSQYEATVSVIGHVLMERLANRREPARAGNGSRHDAPHGCYRCRGEDRWCVIAVGDNSEWGRLCDAIGQPDLKSDPRFATAADRMRHSAELDVLLAGWTSERDPYEVMTALQAAGVAAGVVQTVEDQFRRDRQLEARGFFESVPHARKGRAVATGIPVGLTATPGRTTDTGAAIGRDNAYVFGQILGMSEAEICELTGLGAIEGPE